TDYNPFGTLCQADRANTKFCKDLQETDADAKSNKGVLGPSGIVTKATQLIVFATGAIAVIMVIIGGFKYVVSGGDSNGIQSAKNTILYSLIGLVVAIFAQVIVSFVLARL